MTGARSAAADVIHWLDRRSGSIAIACMLLTLLGGVAVAVHLGGEIRFFDEREYLSIGRSIADHGRIDLYGQPSAYRAPAWPVVIALVNLVGGGLELVRFTNFVFSAIAIASVYGLVLGFGSRAGAAIAAVLMTVYPFAVYTATTFYPQTMAEALIAASLFALTVALRARGRRRTAFAAAAGLGLGICTLTIPTFVYLAPLALVWLALAYRPQALAVGVPLLIAFVVLPAAWTIRNAETLDAFVPLTTSSGFNLLVGNHEGATANGGYERSVIGPYQARVRRMRLSETEADDYYARYAKRWIRRHKADAARLYVEKVANNFNWRNELATEGSSSTAKTLGGAVTYLPLLGLLLLRLLFLRRFPLARIEWLMVAVMALNALLLAIYTTRVRYRVPVDPLMLAMVGAFVAAWLGAAPGLSRSRSG